MADRIRLRPSGRRGCARPRNTGSSTADSVRSSSLPFSGNYLPTLRPTNYRNETNRPHTIGPTRVFIGVLVQLPALPMGDALTVNLHTDQTEGVNQAGRTSVSTTVDSRIEVAKISSVNEDVFTSSVDDNSPCMDDSPLVDEDTGEGSIRGRCISRP